MAVQNITSIAANLLSPLQTNNIPSNNNSTVNTQNFSDLFKNALNNVNQTQVDSDNLTQQFANGDNVDINQVMIAAQKASVTLQATLEVRNKVVDAYQQMMNMQV
ncbi:flagellar hook-basal body complex protein FliE [Heyndrickxia acidicola]|uniref:Flagellar hook-basal body complex protein FliE n=1 Tax=Heyndrickxia acidicola TaxID=209389 RepID=A0ABU6MEG9_9BACI|nr:flagellar hook-basal body complex protein FliE [Heyndrickxia acidicola]MED1202078.1 flagellar hook-basal body complex protein FliE [Heyndrickxia acidicola]